MKGPLPGGPQSSDAIERGGPTVLWTRGPGCASLAALLGGDRTQKADGDLRTACIRERADLLIARSFSSFDLIDVAVPHHFELERVRSVVATVAGGPHSSLAAAVAGYVATSLGVPGRIVTASPSPADDAKAETVLAGLRSSESTMSRDVVRAATAKAFVEDLPRGTLLILGAPGGSWMQRQFFGPGRKLLYSASGGAVVVRSAPRRCFQAAGPVAPLGIDMRVRDAEFMLDGRHVMPVAEVGRLVGIVRAVALNGTADETTIGEVMEPPVFLHVEDFIEDAAEMATFLDGGAVPVVDRDGVLFGELEMGPRTESTEGRASPIRDVRWDSAQ